MTSISAAVLFTSLLGSQGGGCVTIPDAVARRRPEPIERFRTRDILHIPLEKTIAAAQLIVEGTVHPIRTYLSDDKCALYTDYAVQVTNVYRGIVPKATRPGEQSLVVTLFGGDTEIDRTKVIVRDQQLPLFTPGQRVLLLLSKTRLGRRDVYQPVFETLGAFDLIDGTLKHIHELGIPMYDVDKTTLLDMIRK